jgi:hypothetical protein
MVQQLAQVGHSMQKKTALNAYAPLASSSFTGTVTFIDTSTTPNITSVITDYLKSSIASSTYLTQTNAASTYLTQTNAATTYATKVSPSFSGTVTFIDTSTTPNTTSVITDYLKSSIASSTYLTQNI